MAAYALGWKPADPQAWAAMPRFTPAAHLFAALPAHYTLDFTVVPNLDQGSEGSCGPHSAVECLMYVMKAQGIAQYLPSRNGLYWTVRKIMGTTGEDSGVDNHAMAKALQQYGFADEHLDPYSPQTLTKQPSAEYFKQALVNRTSDYLAVEMDLAHLKAAIQSNKRPVVVGYDVYPSMMTDAVAKTGVIPMPRRGESPEGGHDCSFFGWDDQQQVLYFRNHWRDGNRWWGTGGNGAMPYAYYTRYASNPLLLRSIPGSANPTPTPAPQPNPQPSPQPSPGENPVNVASILAWLKTFLATPLGQAIEQYLLKAAASAGLSPVILQLLAMLLGTTPPANVAQCEALMKDFAAQHGITV